MIATIRLYIMNEEDLVEEEVVVPTATEEVEETVVEEKPVETPKE